MQLGSNGSFLLGVRSHSVDFVTRWVSFSLSEPCTCYVQWLRNMPMG